MAATKTSNTVTIEEIKELLENLSKLIEEEQNKFLYMIKGAAFVTQNNLERA